MHCIVLYVMYCISKFLNLPPGKARRGCDDIITYGQPPFRWACQELWSRTTLSLGSPRNASVRQRHSNQRLAIKFKLKSLLLAITVKNGVYRQYNEVAEEKAARDTVAV